ncbi:WGxxGxxG family protein [Streptomyces sp. NPDC012403]|jgi:MYXO-CTERM domain-containing protein|uniref:WGxxGxxG family protein n=1 Tax=unclassified Streptomyces TaxID=2593676 RepID=UPI001C22A0B3|nr:WGxxGxxG family protein [Streptomyces sp. AC558_RSS880]
MRKFVGTVVIGVLLAVAPAGAAFGQTTEQTAQPTTATVVQAQDDNDDDGGGNGGLWGLLGLLGLAGLIPRKSKREHHRGTSGATRM